MNEVKKYTEKIFEDIKHVDEYGNEYWSPRELQLILNYREWRKFSNVINKTKVACDNSNFIVHEHFVQADKMIKLAKWAGRNIAVIKLMNIFPMLGSCQKEIMEQL